MLAKIEITGDSSVCSAKGIRGSKGLRTAERRSVPLPCCRGSQGGRPAVPADSLRVLCGTGSSGRGKPSWYESYVGPNLVIFGHKLRRTSSAKRSCPSLVGCNPTPRSCSTTSPTSSMNEGTQPNVYCFASRGKSASNSTPYSPWFGGSQTPSNNTVALAAHLPSMGAGKFFSISATGLYVAAAPGCPRLGGYSLRENQVV